MTTILIEDDAVWRGKLQVMLDTLQIEILASVDNVEDAVAAIEKKRPDFIVADVFLGLEQVFDLFKQNKKFCTIPTIFITQSDKEITYKEATIADNMLFLVKPFHKLTLRSSIEALLNTKTTKVEQSLHIKGKHNSKIDLPLKHIVFLQQDDHYCFLHTSNNEKIVMLKPLRDVMKELDNRFIQVHRTYCINTDYIINFSAGLQSVKVKTNELPIPIGVSFKEGIKKHIADGYIKKSFGKI
jgi:two-component system, LytTR family, response regulator LytT